ncbi:MnhB domain-containing protein [Deinococcus peraridilitoris]|uniref:Multisubunit Na+/H+ antiporter, MnhB subunit n=1 Tax=Deinococcus peraridilitoris (strain DSM 19664 / LMG 22246 / CIP 109416 / KR-200) TaxID=937777 RepID=L0A0Y2_DEIPD|nr:MnhB domain-containing protein [Deinococcus peraridilitoris]AFZ66650.1 multisubunit Na+/H+ antiporter, MnhB subunit [Deinococcus peraridilitoris DSM 19664]
MSRPEGGAPQGALQEHDPILQTVARAVFYLVLLFSLHMLWRGHNEPGGGFIAGLITSAAMILHRVAFGKAVTLFNPLVLLPWGLGVAALTGLVPLLFGSAFLKSAYGYISPPFIGEFEWATAFVFDVGVYIVVVGATMSVIGNLALVRPTETPRDADAARLGEARHNAHDARSQSSQGER